MSNHELPAGFEKDDMTICPYNKAHHISLDRLQTHLYKCRKAHSDIKLAICPFNTTHHIPELELQVSLLIFILHKQKVFILQNV